MNVSKNRSCNVTVVPKKPPLEENNVNTTHSKMPLDNRSLVTEGCDAKRLKNELNIKNHSLTDNTNENPNKGSFSIGNIPQHSNDYLLDYCNQNLNMEPNVNHKFYGCKRRDYPSHCCESFGLPDDPIFANSPQLVDRTPLDINVADPCNICVINPDNINQPWLIEDQHVITPYWSIDSLFPFEVEDIRHKIEPDNLYLANQNNTSEELVDSSINTSKDQDTVFTSTPLKIQSDSPSHSLSVVSTISVPKNDDKNVDIALLKDQVLKVLEEAIKKKSSMTNIDMKIQIVADSNGAPEATQESTVEVRINESISTKPCQSSSSSKENFCINTFQSNKSKTNNINFNTVTLSDWSDDWQDQECNLPTQQGNLTETDKFRVTKGCSTLKREKKKNKRKRKQYTLPSIHRNLRSATTSRVLVNQEQEGLLNKMPQPSNLKRRSSKSCLNGMASLTQCMEETIEPTEDIEINSQIQLKIDKLSQSLKTEGKIRRELKTQEARFVKEDNKSTRKTESLIVRKVTKRRQLSIFDKPNLQPSQHDINSTRTLNDKKYLEEHMLEEKLSPQNGEIAPHKHTKQRRVTRSSLRNEVSLTSDNESQIKSSSENGNEHASESISNKCLPNIKHAKVVSDKHVSEDNCIKDILLSKNRCQLPEKVTSRSLFSKEKVNQKEDEPVETIERRITRSRIRNDLSQSLSQSESDVDNSTMEKSQCIQGRSQKSLHFKDVCCMGRKNGEKKKLIDSICTVVFQEESTRSKDKEVYKGKLRHMPAQIIKKRFSNDNYGNSNDTASDCSDHEEESFRRILRSSNQSLKKNPIKTRQRRRRTFSNSEGVVNGTHKNVPPRKRSVSANFDNKRGVECFSPPEIRRLRSQVPERISSKLDLKKGRSCKDLKIVRSSIKSPRISFDLNASCNDSLKGIQSHTPLKGILKNSLNEEHTIVNTNLRHKHRPTIVNTNLRHKHVPNLDVMDYGDGLEDLPKLEREDNPEQELNDKKEAESVLKENGITSRVRVVISPFDIKDDNQESLDRTCPLLPLELPVENKTEIKNITKHNANGNRIQTKPELLQKEIVDNKTAAPDLIQVKEIKSENFVYNIGNFVWAQVAKYPYWPAVVCKDPITDTFYNEVHMKNRTQSFYHIRFFGDCGRRAWVKRTSLMLYCSRHDLEAIAKKLKSENKSYNAVKPYLVQGGHQIVEKWNKANEEVELVKEKTPEEIVTYLIKCYETYVNKRREKRKLNALDAFSESESEEPDAVQRPRRKRFKSSHVTSEEINHSVGFDEINISAEAKNNIDIVSKSNLITEIESSSKQTIKKLNNGLKELLSPEQTTSLDHCPLEIDDKSLVTNEPVEVTAKVTPRRSRRSLKTTEKINTSKTTEKINTSDSQPEKLESIPRESNAKLEKTTNSESAALETSTIKNEYCSNLSLAGNKDKAPDLVEVADVECEPNSNNQQSDEASEVGSKTSSDGSSSIPNMYSFEYQVELHKKNTLFNGLRNVKVCDYCMKQGDLYKCKGKCGGFFHLECASRVTEPRNTRRPKNKEKSPTKSKARLGENSADSTPRSKRSEDCCTTRSQSQCQIITIKTRHVVATPKKDNLPDNFHELSLADQIDYGMKEMMSKFDDRTVYHDLTDSSSEEGFTHCSKIRPLGITDSPASTSGSEKEAVEEKTSDDLEVSMISENACSSTSIKHVTADSVILTEVDTPMDITNLKCTYCRTEKDPPCYSCGLEVSKRGDSARQKCSQFRCGRYYHPHCLKMWPQTQWAIGKWSKNHQAEDSFTCPAHTCHTCFSEELGSTAACRLPGDRLARCLLCPAAFHTTTFCIPAGTEILGGSQIVCPRHRSKHIQPINTVWCFICSEGGNLVCCDMCPTSVHPECQPVNFTDDDKYICEDCESGRFPLYDEIVWVKLGQYRWWPAIVLFPNEVPENVRALKHQRGDFAVRFFGTHDHYWVSKSRSFLFQEGDRGGSPGESTRSKNKVYETFGKAIEDAALAYKLKKEFKLRREAESISSLKPPSYIRINKNRPVGNVKCTELNLSNATACECDPSKSHPCGSDTNCINRLLMTECDPDICRAGVRCRNQAFQKREYPPMVPYKTQGRGWGLKSLAPIKMGQFVIEYVGDLIDSEEYQRRIKKMHEKKEENYYFMTVDSDRMIDAGPKGNLSRFMNHSCNPNCVTQKWTVKGDTRVGLFAKYDIETGSELTFNYNLEVVGQEKKVCKCGAVNCSGYIGVKAKLDKPEKTQTDSVATPTEQRRSRKKRAATPPLMIPPCFICGRKKSDITCNNKFCNKGYHLKCLKLDEVPDASKYTCPRHNCNICSNRTIRCCVKCINSFCPSHSDGNIRHDKFLGFVCRLHDPGISSTDGFVESVKELPNRRCNRKSLCDTPLNKRPGGDEEKFSPLWQKQKQRLLINPCSLVAQPGDAIPSESLQQKAEKFKCTFGSNTNKTVMRRKSTNRRATTIKQIQRRRIRNGLSSLSAEEMEARRAKWRITTAKYRLKKRTEELQKIAAAETGTKHFVVEDNNASIDPKNNMTGGQEAIASVTHINASAKDGNEIVTSFKIGTHEVDIITISSTAERSEFDTTKFIKKGRQKPDPTDESAVSSTTSDESDICSKPSDAKKTRRVETDRTFVEDKNDHVSSSPIKRTRESSSDSSDDELSLSLRLEKKNSRKSNKKIRFKVNGLLSTAKTS